MKIINNDTCDFSGPYQQPRHVPETAFERQLLKEWIESRLSPFNLVNRETLETQEVEIFIGCDAEWSQDGWLNGKIEIRDPKANGVGSLLSTEYLPIQLCVCERECPASESFRTELVWRMEKNQYSSFDQSNSWPYAPVLARL